jgi:EAL and modified HD-GYP domain-containing signal transduction protein
MMKISGDIRKALVEKDGVLAPVLDFVLQYEDANWQEVSRQMLLGNISLDAVQQAYMGSLQWYKELTTE